MENINYVVPVVSQQPHKYIPQSFIRTHKDLKCSKLNPLLDTLINDDDLLNYLDTALYVQRAHEKTKLNKTYYVNNTWYDIKTHVNNMFRTSNTNDLFKIFTRFPDFLEKKWCEYSNGMIDVSYQPIFAPLCTFITDMYKTHEDMCLKLIMTNFSDLTYFLNPFIMEYFIQKNSIVEQMFLTFNTQKKINVNTEGLLYISNIIPDVLTYKGNTDTENIIYYGYSELTILGEFTPLSQNLMVVKNEDANKDTYIPYILGYNNDNCATHISEISHILHKLITIRDIKYILSGYYTPMIGLYINSPKYTNNEHIVITSINRISSYSGWYGNDVNHEYMYIYQNILYTNLVL